MSFCDEVEILRSGLKDVAATVSAFSRPASAPDATPVGTPDSRLGSVGSRRSSRSSSMSSIDSAASDRPAQMPTLQFLVVDFVLKQLHSTGLSAEQITTLHAFCTRNEAVISGLDMLVEPPMLAGVPTRRVVPLPPQLPPSIPSLPPHPVAVPPTATVPASPKRTVNLSSVQTVMAPAALMPLSDLHTSASTMFSELAVGLDTPPSDASLDF
jgi:hypothetical protein